MNPRPSPDETASRPTASEPEGRVLPGALPVRHAPPGLPPDLPPDLAKFERRADEPDDYRHRMAMNALAFIATVALIVVGIWIADVMAHMRKDQDCVLTGRAGCTPVEVPPRPR
jgi:hypothetical protein